MSRQLHAFRDKDQLILSWDVAHKFIVWLVCGHSAGVVKAGTAVSRRKCHACNARRDVSHAEPVRE